MKVKCPNCGSGLVAPQEAVNRKLGGYGILCLMVIIVCLMGWTMSSYDKLSMVGAIVASIPVSALFVLLAFFWAKRQFHFLETLWQGGRRWVALCALMGGVILSIWGVNACMKDDAQREKDDEQRRKNAMIEMEDAIKQGGYYDMAECPYCKWRNSVWISVDAKGGSSYFMTGRLRCERCMKEFQRMALPPPWEQYR